MVVGRNTKFFICLICFDNFGYIFFKLSMEQFSINENKISPHNETIEICMNDTIMEEEFEENLNVQIGNPIVETKGSRNEKKESE